MTKISKNDDIEQNTVEWRHKMSNTDRCIFKIFFQSKSQNPKRKLNLIQVDETHAVFPRLE